MGITADSLYPPPPIPEWMTRCQRCGIAPTYSGRCCGTCGCRYNDLLLSLVIASNGVHQYRRECDICGHLSETIRHRDVSSLARIRLLSDNRCGDCQGEGCDSCVENPCAKCGGWERVQMHHWAPRHLFPGVADDWPISPLCQACHAEWHRIVTPRMAKPKPVQWW